MLSRTTKTIHRNLLSTLLLLVEKVLSLHGHNFPINRFYKAGVKIDASFVFYLLETFYVTYVDLIFSKKITVKNESLIFSFPSYLFGPLIIIEHASPTWKTIHQENTS